MQHSTHYYHRISNTTTDNRWSCSMLVDMVSDIARNLFQQLGPGLPKSVYQLMLCRQLAELGVVLESERLLSGQSQHVNDAIVMDRCLLIACLAGNGNTPASQISHMMMTGSVYQMTMLIEFGNDISLHMLPAHPAPKQCH